ASDGDTKKESGQDYSNVLTYLKFDRSSRPFGNLIESFPILPNLPLFKSHFQYALTESLKQGDEEDCLGRPIEFKRE
ncbi:MAG: hypothetical protein VXX20_07540, partial [Verrucomicrobiota bacterium]|nr:hypothetical protein [Verrucomicrobiota bacterium]